METDEYKTATEMMKAVVLEVNSTKPWKIHAAACPAYPTSNVEAMIDEPTDLS